MKANLEHIPLFDFYSNVVEEVKNTLIFGGISSSIKTLVLSNILKALPLISSSFSSSLSNSSFSSSFYPSPSSFSSISNIFITLKDNINQLVKDVHYSILYKMILYLSNYFSINLNKKIIDLIVLYLVGCRNGSWFGFKNVIIGLLLSSRILF